MEVRSRCSTQTGTSIQNHFSDGWGIEITDNRLAGRNATHTEFRELVPFSIVCRFLKA